LKKKTQYRRENCVEDEKSFYEKRRKTLVQRRIKHMRRGEETILLRKRNNSVGNEIQFSEGTAMERIDIPD
jgi:hypothetical protein